MTARMHILFLFDHYYPYIGGAETVNRQIAEHFARQHTVTVVSKSFSGLNDRRRSINGAAVVRTPNVPRVLHSLTGFLYGGRHAARADVIVCATYASALAGYWLARRFKKKSVLLAHEILGEHWKYFKRRTHGLYRRYERCIVTRPFDRYVAVSSYTARGLQQLGIPENKITVIHHGIDSALFSPRDADPAVRRALAGDAAFVYVYFGRPGGTKGLEYLLRAVAAIRAQIPGSRLVLILGAEPRAEYRSVLRLIDRLGIGDAVAVHPSVPRDVLPDHVAAADVVVVPSLCEGFGLTAAESCALGKTVVATDTGALPEVLSGPVITVKKADSAALADGVIRAWRGECQHIPAKHFSWDEALRKYENLLLE